MPRQDLIERFLSQEHLTFVGVYRRLRDGGRTMYPVNARADTVEGDRSYRRLADVPSPVDGVVIMVPADSVTDVVLEAVARGIPRVWLHRGPGQKPVPANAVVVCHDHDIEVVDGACPLMFEAPVRGIHRLHHFVVRRRFAA